MSGTVRLDDSDRALLRRCPFDITTYGDRTPTQAQAAEMKRVKRLWSAGFISGAAESLGGKMTVLRLKLRKRGYEAIGRAAPADGAS